MHFRDRTDITELNWALHMSPVDRAGSVTEMKLVSVHMVTFSPLSEMKVLKSGDATIQA